MKMLLIYIISVYGDCFSYACQDRAKTCFPLTNQGLEIFEQFLPFNSGENLSKVEDNQILSPLQRNANEKGGSIPTTFENQGESNTLKIDIVENQEKVLETLKKKRFNCKIDWKYVLKWVFLPISILVGIIILFIIVLIEIAWKIAFISFFIFGKLFGK